MRLEKYTKQTCGTQPSKHTQINVYFYGKVPKTRLDKFITRFARFINWIKKDNTASMIQKNFEHILNTERTRLAEDERKTLTEIYNWIVNNLLRDCLIIDSNIWMNEDYDSFFDKLISICKHIKYKIKLYGVQFDEICNIKKNTSYGEKKNIRARIAIDRIEKFQKIDVLTIESITMDAHRGAYADPIIVKLLYHHAQNGKYVSFVADDIELRVRVRGYLNKLQNPKYNIIELENEIWRFNDLVL